MQVTEAGTRSWIYRYTSGQRRREMGLGAYPDVSLKAARDKAAECRTLRVKGIDPLEEKRAALAAERGTVTFREAAGSYIAAHKPSWRNAKHRQQWSNTLKAYAYPVFGDISVNAIDTPLILKVLEPIWMEKTETAKRLRGRIENVLDWATVRNYRKGENPARWRGHLDKLLARPTKVARVQHHKALPFTDMPAFFAELHNHDGAAAKALEFVILTACRTGEVIGARWEEIEGDIWTVPGERMKSSRDHRVALSPQAVAVLNHMRQLSEGCPFVFPGAMRGRPLSNMAMSAVLRRMGRNDITVHGFRSAFRDWCGEQTNYPREVAEAALAHVLRDKTEAAYARGDLFKKRARLMEAWAKFCTTSRPAGEVVELTGAK